MLPSYGNYRSSIADSRSGVSTCISDPSVKSNTLMRTTFFELESLCEPELILQRRAIMSVSLRTFHSVSVAVAGSMLSGFGTNLFIRLLSRAFSFAL